ncbi:hypothetical protein E2562_027335 [Oryza meyeriana var. granulata]|uniref:BURP domain-containing protein n=1 Tax=Oryza meyeriana var. granulata TaxID=110450 RepID=A0A6G1E320_9ORYZ|nr:hypothetical protein E2562_027335 [Oryza meyeriana var. granulata]
MAYSSSPPHHNLFLFALAFLAVGAADAWPAWGNGRMFFSKATRPEAVELDKVAVATTAAAADTTNSNSASEEFSRPSSGGSNSRGYGRPEESYPEAYFRRGVHHDAEKLTTTNAAAATAEQEKEEEAAPAGVTGDNDAWLGYPEDGSGRGRPLPYARMRGGQQQHTTTNAAAATAEQEKEQEAAAAGVAGDGAGLGYPEDGSGRGRPLSYARMRGGQQQQQQYDYGMSDTRLYQNGRYYYDVNTGKYYGYGRASNPVRTRPEEFGSWHGGRRYGANAAYANGNDQEEFGTGYRAGEQVGRRYGNGNVAGKEYANGNDQEFGTGYRAGEQTGRWYDGAAAVYDSKERWLVPRFSFHTYPGILIPRAPARVSPILRVSHGAESHGITSHDERRGPARAQTLTGRSDADPSRFANGPRVRKTKYNFHVSNQPPRRAADRPSLTGRVLAALPISCRAPHCAPGPAAMAAAAAARSFLRSGVASSSSVRGAAARAASRAGTAPLPRRPSAAAPRLLVRSPVEMSSVCLETLMPMHSATASALMTSLLTGPSCRSFGWLSEAGNDDV